MKRKCPVLLLVFLLLMCGSPGHGTPQVPAANAQARADTADIARLADVYAVYSELLKDPLEGRFAVGKDTVLLIEGATGALGSNRPPSEACFPRTPANEQEWNELLSDLSGFRYIREILEASRLNTTRPVNLLDGKAVEAIAQQFIEAVRVRGFDPDYATAPRLFRLSHVFFNQKRTLALVQVSMRCGVTCGEGRWRVLEKTNEQWRAYPTPPGRPPCPPIRIL